MSTFPTSLVLLILSIALLLEVSGEILRTQHSTYALRVLQQVSANYELVVQLHSYKNKKHKEKRGYCCESYFRRRCKDDCDNIFYFCLQPRYNSGWYPDRSCLRLNGIYSDRYNFGGRIKIVFYSFAPWPVSCLLSHHSASQAYHLYVYVFRVQLSSA